MHRRIIISSRNIYNDICERGLNPIVETADYILVHISKKKDNWEIPHNII